MYISYTHTQTHIYIYIYINSTSAYLFLTKNYEIKSKKKIISFNKKKIEETIYDNNFFIQLFQQKISYYFLATPKNRFTIIMSMTNK